jgi:ubiquinone/menaquinone biosynthesis C-methylase UbiE
MPWFMSVIYDRFMKASEEACLAEWRGELFEGLSGDVLEIGAGTGASLRHYPAAVTRLVATEPDRYMIPKLRERARRDRPGRVEIVEAAATALPFADGSFDAVVSSLVLCSVDDLDRALAEVRRVLRPGGALAYMEHVAADERPARLAWQHRVEPFWKLVAGNCHLTRRTADAIRAAGFAIEREERDSMRKANPLTRATVRGIARKRS